MIRLILVAFFLIAFLILSAIPLLIGEYLIYKNDEKKQQDRILIEQVLQVYFVFLHSEIPLHFSFHIF